MQAHLKALFDGDVDMNDDEVRRIIDFSAVQVLMESFYKVTGIGMSIVDFQGNVLVATGWQDICTRFHRVHPQTLANCIESDVCLARKIEGENYTIYKCKNNMWDLATPITVGGKYIGSLFLGQFLFEDEEPDRDVFTRQAETYGFDRKEYLAALERVPRWSRETVHSVMEFYTHLAHMIAELSYRNIQLANVLAERQQADEALQQAHDDLERRVAERTEELAGTIDVLKKEICERRRVEEVLKAETLEKLQTLEKLREKDQMLIQQSRMAAMGEMINNIAHQWRQPLNTLGLAVQLLQLRYKMCELDEACVDEITGKAMEKIRYMSQTIDDFRYFFHPNKEKMEFDVNQVVTKTVSLIEESCKSLGINVVVDVMDDPHIVGYPNEFSQVILNILNNARDVLTERKCSDPAIMVRTAEIHGKVVVTVADNAGGVPEEIIRRIFEPYFTTKGPDRGTGLGLFMSKTIIERNMNGKLSVGNTDGGAEFRIEI